MKFNQCFFIRYKNTLLCLFQLPLVLQFIPNQFLIKTQIHAVTAWRLIFQSDWSVKHWYVQITLKISQQAWLHNHPLMLERKQISNQYSAIESLRLCRTSSNECNMHAVKCRACLAVKSTLLSQSGPKNRVAYLENLQLLQQHLLHSVCVFVVDGDNFQHHWVIWRKEGRNVTLTLSTKVLQGNLKKYSLFSTLFINFKLKNSCRRVSLTLYCVWILVQGILVCTGADVQNVVVPVLGLDSVHGDLGQFPPARLRLQQHRLKVLGQDGAIHHRMRTHKPQHLVRKLLGAGEATAIDFTGTLVKRGCGWDREEKEEWGQRQTWVISCVSLV